MSVGGRRDLGGREGDRRRFGGVCGGSVKPQSTTRADGVSSAVSLRHSNTGLQRRTRLGPTGENGPARPASLCPPGVCLDDASRANRGVLGDRDAYRPLTPHVQPPHPPQPPPWCAGEGRAGDNNGRVDPPTHPTTTPPHAADRAVARWQSGGEPEWGHLDLLGGEGETGRPSRGGGRGARRVLPAAAAPGVCSQPMGGGGPRRDRSGVHARFLHDESGAAVPCFSPKATVNWNRTSVHWRVGRAPTLMLRYGGVWSVSSVHYPIAAQESAHAVLDIVGMAKETWRGPAVKKRDRSRTAHHLRGGVAWRSAVAVTVSMDTAEVHTGSRARACQPILEPSRLSGRAEG